MPNYSFYINILSALSGLINQILQTPNLSLNNNLHSYTKIILAKLTCGYDGIFQLRFYSNKYRWQPQLRPSRTYNSPDPFAC